MKLSDNNININETVVYGGEKFNRSSNHSHGDILALIDHKKNRIDLHKSELQGTLNAMKKNEKLAGAAILVCLGTILFLVFLFFWTASSGLFGIAFRCLLIIAVFYLLFQEVKNIIIYLIHTQGKFLGYAKNHKIIPAIKAQEYCAKNISKLNIYKQEIDKIESKIKSNPNADADELYNALSAIDVEVKNIYDIDL